MNIFSNIFPISASPYKLPLSGEALRRELVFHLLAQGRVLGEEQGQACHDFGAFDDGRFDGPGLDGIGDVRRVFRHGDVAQGQVDVDGRALMADVADVGAAAILWFFVRDPHGLEDLFRRFRRRFIPDHVIEFAAHLGDVICRFRSNGRPFEAVHDLGHDGIEIFPFAVADTTFDFGVIGDDVGGGPTVYDI